ncbi:MAG: 2-oxoacid:acceptor oxidoreductase family protein [Candidatus Cryosericum sp.]
MKEVYEVRMHARAGQGAKSGSQLLAEAAFKEGKYIQSFPEYGSERRGAPTVAYTKIAEKVLRSHEPVVNPDVVMVLDYGIMRSIAVAAGLPETGILIVNTKVCAAEIQKLAKFSGPTYNIDATSISLDMLGMDTPNVPMLGALIKLTGIVKMESLEKVLREHFLSKLGEEKVQKNIEMLHMGYEGVSK